MLGVVNTPRLNVRLQPDENGLKLGVVTEGTVLNVLAQRNGWLEILYQNRSAFVFDRYVKLDGVLDGATEPETPATAIVREAQDQQSNLLPQQLLPVAGAAVERKVASAWNSFGGLLQRLSDEKQIDVACAVAVLCVESSGKGFEPGNDNRMIIRFENHKFWKYWGESNADTFHQHFRYQQGQAWKGHQWRKDRDGDWLTFHGNQRSEWEVLTFARSLDNDAALFSISMGAPQIMGFNYRAVGYRSVQDMFDAFTSGIEPHITGLFDFMSPAMVKKLQVKDFEGFAGLYNGSGQKVKYGAWIKDHYDAYKRLV